MNFSIAVIAASLLLAGCANLGAGNRYQPYPQAQYPASGHQDKLQAVQHWDVLAQNEAKLLAQSVPVGSVVRIVEKQGGSSFSSAYRKLLAQHLLAQGLKISHSRNAADYLLDYEVQVVVHSDRDALRHPAGSFSAVGASAWLIKHAVDNWGDPGLVAVPFFVAADMYLANNRDANTPNTEVLITTSLHRGSMLVQSSNRIYYFNAGDMDLYKPPAKSLPAKSFRITNKP